MESTWKDIFRITEDGEVIFDAAHSEHINSYIDIFQERVKPHNDSNFNRLINDHFYTRKIELHEIKEYLKRSKRKAPGESKISKVILEKFTENTMQQLVNIFNISWILPHTLQKRNYKIHSKRKQKDIESFKLQTNLLTRGSK